jgi:uncharacterized membrane protein
MILWYKIKQGENHMADSKVVVVVPQHSHNYWGTVSGAGIGAVIGTSVFPVIGTALGAVIGGLAGFTMRDQQMADAQAQAQVITVPANTSGQ